NVPGLLVNERAFFPQLGLNRVGSSSGSRGIRCDVSLNRVREEEEAEEGRVRVLVADRDSAVCDLLARALSRRGFAVQTLNGALGVVAQLAASPAEVVVVQAGGTLELRPIRELRDRADLDHVRVLAMLPPDEDDEIASALEEGADDCMVKPISPRE